MRRLGRLVPLLALCGLAQIARADILVGQTTDLSGPSSASTRECIEGARLLIDAVNARGGIDGQKIRLDVRDDGFDPKRSAANARALIDEGVVSMFLTRGTPHTLAILPLLARYQVPLIAPSTGAMALNEPVNPWVFNVRSTYQLEAERAVDHLVLVGTRRLVVLQTDDAFGADAVQGVLKGLSDARLAPAALIKFDRRHPDFDRVMPEVLQADPQAVFFIGSSDSVAGGIARLRAAGSHAQAVTLSNNASDGFIKELGVNARGVIVSQVFPYERSFDDAFVRDARALADKRGLRDLTPQMLEGFAAAKVLVGALRRAGPHPTRESVLGALNGMHDFDLGGLTLHYSPTHHGGLEFVDLSIIDETGHFLR